MPHFAAGIVVFELQPYWEAELKRAFQNAGLAVSAVRHADDWYRWLQTRPGSVGLWNLQGPPANCLHTTARVLETRLPVSLGVISPSHWHDLEWPLRELGVQQFWREGAIRDDVLQWCRRNLGQTTPATSRESGCEESGTRGF